MFRLIFLLLYKVNEEIDEMEANIDKLKEAINEKPAPMTVSQTRSDHRTERPNIELCRDPGTVPSLLAR